MEKLLVSVSATKYYRIMSIIISNIRFERTIVFFLPYFSFKIFGGYFRFERTTIFFRHDLLSDLVIKVCCTFQDFIKLVIRFFLSVHASFILCIPVKLVANANNYSTPLCAQCSRYYQTQETKLFQYSHVRVPKCSSVCV